MNGFKFQVESKSAHQFLMGLFDTHHCDLEHLHPWLVKSIVKI